MGTPESPSSYANQRGYRTGGRGAVVSLVTLSGIMGGRGELCRP